MEQSAADLKRPDAPSLYGDLWCARNLGVLSLLGMPLPIFGVVVLELSLVSFSWEGPGFVRFAVSFVSLALSFALLVLGGLLVVQCFCYPRILFGRPARMFWQASIFYCPAWIVPPFLLFLQNLSSWQPGNLLSSDSGGAFLAVGLLMVTFGLFPIAHVVLSVMGYRAWLGSRRLS